MRRIFISQEHLSFEICEVAFSRLMNFPWLATAFKEMPRPLHFHVKKASYYNKSVSAELNVNYSNKFTRKKIFHIWKINQIDTTKCTITIKSKCYQIYYLLLKGRVRNTYERETCWFSPQKFTMTQTQFLSHHLLMSRERVSSKVDQAQSWDSHTGTQRGQAAVATPQIYTILATAAKNSPSYIYI